MSNANAGLQHVSRFLSGGERMTQSEIDAYLTSGRCINDPHPRQPAQMLRVVEVDESEGGHAD